MFLSPKEKEAGEKIASLMLEAASLADAEAGSSDYERRLEILDEIDDINRKLEKTHCNCHTRHGLLKEMRKNIGYRRWGLVARAAKEFMKTIEDDLS